MYNAVYSLLIMLLIKKIKQRSLFNGAFNAKHLNCTVFNNMNSFVVIFNCLHEPVLCLYR